MEPTLWREREREREQKAHLAKRSVLLLLLLRDVYLPRAAPGSRHRRTLGIVASSIDGCEPAESLRLPSVFQTPCILLLSLHAFALFSVQSFLCSSIATCYCLQFGQSNSFPLFRCDEKRAGKSVLWVRTYCSTDHSCRCSLLNPPGTK